MLSLALVLELAASCTPFKNLLPVFVHLQLDNNHLGGMDAHVHRRTVGLLPLNPLNVDHILLAVDLHHLAHLLALVVSAHHLNFVVFPDGHAADIVLLPKILRQR